MLVCKECGAIVQVEQVKTGSIEGEFWGHPVHEPWYEDVYFCPNCGYVEAIEADLVCPDCIDGYIDGVECETCDGFGTLTEEEYEEIHYGYLQK
jgi:hypothetical protein